MKREIFLKKINLTGCPYVEAEQYRLEAEIHRTAVIDDVPCVWLTDDAETLAALERDGECAVYLLTPKNRDRFCPQAKWCLEESDSADMDFLWQVWLRSHDLPWQICETDRLYLREMTEEDLDFLYQCRQDAESARFVAGPTADRETEIEKIAAYRKLIYGFYGFGLWMVCEKETGQPVGRAGLQIGEDSEFLELGFETAPFGRRKGYAQEAVRAVLAYAKEELEQEKLCVRVEEENTASRQLCQRLGFMETQRQIKDEKHWIIYEVILREEET